MTAERSHFRVLGLDPGLRLTGWGVIDVRGNRLSHVADGVISSTDGAPTAARLVQLFRGIGEVIERFSPDQAAVEETFVNKNATTTLKLGLARGVVLLAPAERGLEVAEYAANLVKKSVVGVGHAEKPQVQMMVRRLLPGCLAESADAADAADALAVAICHAHHAQTNAVWRAAPSPGIQQIPLPAGERLGEGAPQRARILANVRSGGLAAAAKRKPTPAETSQARRLRRDNTNVERVLWRHLRNRQLEGVKFRRQEPILQFTVDFVAHERKLVVELDGGQRDARSEQDARRTALLEQSGFRVLRFWNNEVSGNLEGVIETILVALRAAPSPCPSPQWGEGTLGTGEKEASR